MGFKNCLHPHQPNHGLIKGLFSIKTQILLSVAFPDLTNGLTWSEECCDGRKKKPNYVVNDGMQCFKFSPRSVYIHKKALFHKNGNDFSYLASKSICL